MIPPELSPWLDTLDRSRIDALKIDLTDKKIFFKLAPQDKDAVEVKFEGVNAFYYIDDSDTTLSADQMNDMIRSISYHKAGFGEFASVKAYENLTPEASPIEISVPNFAISLDESSMYIEAQSVNINGNQFEVL